MTWVDGLGLGWLMAMVVLAITIAYGWVMNIINLIDGTYESLSTIVVGAVGIVIPFVGAIVHFVAG